MRYCWNCVAKSSQLHHTDDTGLLTPHTCIDLDKFQSRSDRSCVEAAQLLQQQHPSRTKKDFEKLEQSLGVNHAPSGLISSELIAPISSTMYDWMHCYFIGGIFLINLQKFLGASNWKNLDIHGKLSAWTWPKDWVSRGRSAVSFFDGKKPYKEIKPSASECLTLYPILRSFVLEAIHQIHDESVKLAMRSFARCCAVLDLLQRIGKDEHVTPQVLERAIRQHLESYQKAFGDDEWTPKFHFCIHLPMLLQQHGLLVSCWVHERKHRMLEYICRSCRLIHCLFFILDFFL